MKVKTRLSYWTFKIQQSFSQDQIKASVLEKQHHHELTWSLQYLTLENVWAASSSYVLKRLLCSSVIMLAAIFSMHMHKELIDYKILSKLRERKNIVIRSDFLWAFYLWSCAVKPRLLIQTLNLTVYTRAKYNKLRLQNTPGEERKILQERNEPLSLGQKIPPSSLVLQEPPSLVNSHSGVNNEIPATAAIQYIGKGLLETDENFSSQFILI